MSGNSSEQENTTDLVMAEQLRSALVINKATNQVDSDEEDVTLDDQFMFFDNKVVPLPHRWYIVPASGHTPLARVGHAAVYLPSEAKSNNGKVVSIGGANPDGTYSEVNVLDLNTLRWELLIPPGFKARYEHCAFSVKDETNAGKIAVFGGADMVENMNDIQIVDLTEKIASTLQNVQGTLPSPRTYRCHSALNGRLYVYGGGRQGSDPVSDRQVRQFDLSIKQWSTLDAKGNAPKARQGHSCVALSYESDDGSVKNVMVVHGGMAASIFYDDVNILDLDSATWSGEVKMGKNKPRPCPRAAHVALPYKNKMVVFGGLGRDNGAVLNDLWIFDVKERAWREVKCEGSPPPARLDAAACIIEGLIARDSKNHTPGDYLFITGGMNTEGDVFSDCFIFRLDTL